ncbi:hypothetical protein [Clostridium massiliamazoniense]|uniref:hypothetical protein n=1 Tax=Clostridium massiliamazoniense TaxID=1347366 RepID=UPI0006D7DB09|nr:hypothetical protein [Clostridium massiliamazoniense]
MKTLKNFIIYDNYYSKKFERKIEARVLNMSKKSLSIDEMTYNGEKYEIKAELVELAEGESRTVYLIEKILPEEKISYDELMEVLN